MFGTLDISVSGMRAQRVRMTTIAQNLQNINTTRNAAGRTEAYRRHVAIFAQGADGPGTSGVRIADIVKDPGPLRRVKDPHHQDADADGYVNYPNVDMVTESVDAMEAARAFEANVSVFELSKSMIGSALRILA